MSRKDWGPNGPPVEAYSRDSDPDRFRPLHGFALDLLDRLEAQYDVERTETNDIDEALLRVDLARPRVKLTPADASAASVVVAFTSYPGLVVRFCRSSDQWFPVCGRSCF